MPATVQNTQTAARLQSISDLLAAEGRVHVVDTATRLGVAEETIRRDLRTCRAPAICNVSTAGQCASQMIRWHSATPTPRRLKMTLRWPVDSGQSCRAVAPS